MWKLPLLRVTYQFLLAVLIFLNNSLGCLEFLSVSRATFFFNFPTKAILLCDKENKLKSFAIHKSEKFSGNLYSNYNEDKILRSLYEDQSNETEYLLQSCSRVCFFLSRCQKKKSGFRFIFFRLQVIFDNGVKK